MAVPVEVIRSELEPEGVMICQHGRFIHLDIEDVVKLRDALTKELRWLRRHKMYELTREEWKNLKRGLREEGAK